MQQNAPNTQRSVYMNSWTMATLFQTWSQKRNLMLFYSTAEFHQVHRNANQLWLKIQESKNIKMIKKCQIFNYTVHDKTKFNMSHGFKIDAKIESCCQTGEFDKQTMPKSDKLSNQTYLQPSFFKIPNLTYLSF